MNKWINAFPKINNQYEMHTNSLLSINRVNKNNFKFAKYFSHNKKKNEKKTKQNSFII